MQTSFIFEEPEKVDIKYFKYPNLFKDLVFAYSPSMSQTDYSKRRSNGELICKGCGQSSLLEYCYTCEDMRKPIDYNLTFNNGFFADGILNWEVGSGILPRGPDIELIDKKCTCLTSDLMIKGCTCGGK